MTQPVPHEPPPLPEDAGTGLPGLRTWRGVYLFVLGSFVAWVVALAVFARVFA